MNHSLPVQRANDLPADRDGLTSWLVEDLWCDQAVGILGGEPKCCKSFLALDLAVSVASGALCLRRFRPVRTGPVLLFPAEDALGVVRQRLGGICAAAGIDFTSLQVDVITAPTLRLDLPADRQRLERTVAERRPRLLVLDPLIRLHRIDENDASQVAPLLGFLRELQRKYQLAVMVVHHARKDAGGTRPGQALRGSSELHGWGDSNLYLRRQKDRLTLTTEHRAAPSADPFAVQLTQHGPALALEILGGPSNPPSSGPLTPAHRVREALASLDRPVPVEQLRKLCSMRTTTLCDTLADLVRQGLVLRVPGGYQLKLPLQDASPPIPFPLSPPRDPQGNGNGKHSHLIVTDTPLCSGGG
jgi:hypothetical protein